MAEPYVQVFELPKEIHGENKLTSVVMDQVDFDKLCDEIEQIEFTNITPAIRQENAAKIREAKHIPMMIRGTKTAKLFERFGVQTNLMSVIVRGQGQALLKKLIQ